MGACAAGTGGACAGFAPAAGTSGAAACASGCAAACIASCFDDNTSVVVSNGSSVQTVAVQDVLAGQQIMTFSQGKPTMTEVIRNTREEGVYDFVEIVASTSLEIYSLNVTAEHNTPRYVDPLSFGEEGSAEVVLARNLNRGDLIAVGRKTESIPARVLLVRPFQGNAKNILVTRSGTVVANNMFTTTICDGDEAIFNRSNFSVSLAQWRQLHEAVMTI